MSTDPADYRQHRGLLTSYALRRHLASTAHRLDSSGLDFHALVELHREDHADDLGHLPEGDAA